MGGSGRRARRCRFLVKVGALLRERNGTPPASARSHWRAEQRLRREAHVDQRGGARGVCAQRRALEIEFVRRAARDVVLLVSDDDRHAAHLLDQLRVRLQVVNEVGVVAHAGEHAYITARAGRVVTGVFQRSHAASRKRRLLWVSDLRSREPKLKKDASNRSASSRMPRRRPRSSSCHEWPRR